MDTQFKVVFTGKLQQGFSYDEAIDNLVAITNLNQEKAQKLIENDQPALIRKNLSRENAAKFQQKFQQAGLQVKILRQNGVPRETVPKKSSGSSLPPSPTPQSQSTPRVERQTPPEPTETTENLYSAPKSKLTEPKTPADEWLNDPRKVPASHGWKWVAAGCKMFLGAPLKWIGMSVVALLIASLFTIIPIVGPIIYQFIVVIMAGGLLMAAHNQANGLDFSFGYIFRGFSHNRNQLLMITVIYIGIFLLLGAVAAIFIGGSLLGLFGIGNFDPEAFSTAMTQNSTMFVLIMCIIGLLTIPIMMAYWFTTPLVALAGSKAWAAYKLSLKACARNWVAFLVYGIAILVACAVGFGIISGAIGLITTMFSNNMALMFPLMALAGLLFGLPLMVISGLSLYTGFRDIFHVAQ